MKHLSTALVATTVLAATTGLASIADAQLPPAPLVGGSDTCATPDVIVGTGLFAFDDTLATTGTEGQNESACNVSFGAGTAVFADVWFTWVAPTSGVATFQTCGSTTLDTKIAAYDGNACPTSAALACNDDACNGFTFQSGLVFSCTAGNAYVLQLGLYPGTFPVATPGTGNFSLVVAPPAVNDGCGTPTALSGTGPYAFDTTAATTGAQGQAEATCLFFGSTAIARDVWFTWTAPSTGSFAVVTHGLTRVDTKVAVYDGAGCPATAALGCNDDAHADAQSVATFAATSGNTYAIQLGCSPNAAGGAGEFAIVPASAPTNDSCATPAAWIGTGSFLFDDTFATTGTQGQSELACAFFGSTAVANDVWYAWTPGSSGTATISSCVGTSVDTKIAVYVGSACPTTPAIACQDDTPAGCGPTSFQTEFSFPVVCGSTYVIQLGTYPIYSPPNVGGLGRLAISIAGPIACLFPAVPYCFGDGTGAACPCANSGASGNGCASSVNLAGGNLTATGTASVANDTFALQASGVPNGPGLYFQGTTQPGAGQGIAFGDGLRCAGGSIVRLGIVIAASSASTYPSGATPPNNTPISVKGFVTAGQSLNYQHWYRDSAAFCSPSVFNLTNALSQLWVP